MEHIANMAYGAHANPKRTGNRLGHIGAVIGSHGGPSCGNPATRVAATAAPVHATASSSLSE